VGDWQLFYSLQSCILFYFAAHSKHSYDFACRDRCAWWFWAFDFDSFLPSLKPHSRVIPTHSDSFLIVATVFVCTNSRRSRMLQPHSCATAYLFIILNSTRRGAEARACARMCALPILEF
jgi:hypothetical protein